MFDYKIIKKMEDIRLNVEKGFSKFTLDVETGFNRFASEVETKINEVSSKVETKLSENFSDAVKVKKFTEETGSVIPTIPKSMGKEQTFFLIKMMLDEIMELGATVENSQEVKERMTQMIENSENLPKLEVDEVGIIAEQSDALVDSYYYSLNAMAKQGVNMSKVFNIVHKANMDKRDSETGKFLKRDDGKIIKPDGWNMPDIRTEIIRQCGDDGF